MTDADVDGSHIRTLLLTFFFRQMLPVVERGYLYIAQPPLFKVAEGKKETYLKDEKELTKFLLARIGDDRTLTQGKSKQSASGAKLVALLEKMDSYRTHLANLEAKGWPEPFVRAWLDSDLFRAEDFAEKKRVDLLSREAKALGEFTRADVVSDAEGESFAIELTRSVNGIEKSFRVDPEFASSHEAKRLRESAKAIGTFLVGPYEIAQGEEKTTCATLPDALEAIYEGAKKGLAIQRYKGLGEMNPEQLWETTMDPEKRHLLQVNIEDAVEADEIFSVLMGDEVEPRRDFIEKNALAAKNLDI
jgi:DNA gyrase subunit B